MTGVSHTIRWPRLLAAVFVLLAAWAGWRWMSSDKLPRPPEDPRLTSDTPYRNVRPEVNYVGGEICGSCHAEQAASYRRHPMGKSLAPVSEAAPLESFEPARHKPFAAFGFRFLVVRL